MIKIRVVSHRGRPPANPLEVCLDETGGTMGRLETNQVVLPDPERHVSRVHARIVHRPEGYFILHQGSNPILLNGAKLRIGDQAPLNDGDELAISTYRLRVAVPLHASPEGDRQASAEIQPTPDAALGSTLSRSLRDGLEPTPAPSAGQPRRNLSIEPPAPVSAVDFDLDGPPAGDADDSEMPNSRAELFFSWETDVDWHRASPAEVPPMLEDIPTQVHAAAVVPADDGRASDPVPEPTPITAEGAADDNGRRAPFPPQSGHGVNANRLVADMSTRAVVEGALRRFSPEHLEQRLKHRTMLDSVLSINRKAKLWDLFTGVYPQIAREAREDICRALMRELLMPRGEQQAKAVNDTEGKS